MKQQRKPVYFKDILYVLFDNFPKEGISHIFSINQTAKYAFAKLSDITVYDPYNKIMSFGFHSEIPNADININTCNMTLSVYSRDIDSSYLANFDGVIDVNPILSHISSFYPEIVTYIENADENTIITIQGEHIFAS